MSEVSYFERMFQLHNFKEQIKNTLHNFHIFPAESSRPYLSHIENVENSDYINACYVDVSLCIILFEIQERILTIISQPL